MICAGSAGRVGRHAASFDANGGAGLRQEFAERVLCKRQRSCISASRFESALALFGSARMPVRVGEMSATEPLSAKFAILLAVLAAGLIHMRNCLATLFLGFRRCCVHYFLPCSRRRCFREVAFSGRVPPHPLCPHRCRQYTPVRHSLPPYCAPLHPLDTNLLESTASR